MPHDQPSRKDFRDTGSMPISKTPQDQVPGGLADAVEVLRHRGQAQIFKSWRDDVVKADQCDILRDAQTKTAKFSDHGRCAVIRQQEKSGGNMKTGKDARDLLPIELLSPIAHEDQIAWMEL